MPTKAQIRNKALKRVRALEPGDTPSSDDITDVEEAYDELYKFLVSKKAVTWDSDEDIPEEATYHVVTMLAANIADEYAVPENTYQRLKAEAYGIENVSLGSLGELIDLAKPDRVPDITEGIYF